MRYHLSRLLSGTFIYGGGAFVSRLITFLLLPLTTAYLTPADYGIIGTLAIVSQLLTGLFTLGFGVSLTRCYWSVKDPSDRPGVLWVGYMALLANIAFWITFGILFSEKISWILLNSSQYSYHVFLSIATIGLNSATLPFATYLKMQERAFLVVCLLIIEVLITTSTMIYFVMFLDRHAQGFLEAALIGQAFNFVCISVIGFLEIPLSFKWGYVKEMVLIGYPYIFGLVGYFLLQCSSRYVLQLYHSLDEVGLFFMGMSFARTIELVVSGFISAWPPFFTSFINKQEEASKIFSKVLSYYVLGMSALLALYFTLAKPIVFLMVQPVYYEVWTVIGFLASAGALWGVYAISATGFIFYKKSLWQMMTEIGAGLSSIALSFLLIPFFHKEGAAIATLLAFFILILVSFALNRRLFLIEYEYKRLFKVFSGLAVLAAITFLPISPFSIYMGVMLLSTAAYFTYLWTFCLLTEEKTLVLNLIPGFQKAVKV